MSTLPLLIHSMKRQIIKPTEKLLVRYFPKNSFLTECSYRIARLNEVVSLIYSLDKAYSENKNGQNHQNCELSGLVTRPGFEPRQTESESVVLPLYYRAKNILTPAKIRFYKNSAELFMFCFSWLFFRTSVQSYVFDFISYI